MTDTRNFYIDGAWVAPHAAQDFPVYNPATEEPYATISLGGVADTEEAIAAARRAFPSFSSTTPAERGEILRAILAVYEKRVGDMAEAISTEMGAPIDMALSDQAGAGRSHLKAFIRAVDGFQWERELRPGVAGQDGVRGGWCCRPDHTMELADEPGGPEGRRRAGCWLYHGAEAVRNCPDVEHAVHRDYR